MFDCLDLGVDGKVSIDEIISILSLTGLFGNNQATPRKGQAEIITIDDVRSTLALLDFDHSSTIDFDEFILICGDRAEMLSDSNLIDLFNQLDRDEHGRVHLSDVKTFFQVSPINSKNWQENDNSHDEVTPDD